MKDEIPSPSFPNPMSVASLRSQANLLVYQGYFLDQGAWEVLEEVKNKA